jgi:hypothetical protein
MGIGNGESDEPQPIYVYPTMRSYQRRPRGNICPGCGGSVMLVPRNHEYWLKWPTSETLVPLCNDCGVRLYGD